MISRVGIITNDDIFYNKIRLILRAVADTVRLDVGGGAPTDCEIVFADVRELDAPSGDCVTFGEGGDISFPFRHEDVLRAFSEAKSKTPAGLYLSKDGKHAFMNGRAVALTKVEFRLLERMLDVAVGEFISRDELLLSVWGGECDSGVVVVYMHYLRKKLEANGERVIVTKRDRGDSKYKIDEKYRGR